MGEKLPSQGSIGVVPLADVGGGAGAQESSVGSVGIDDSGKTCREIDNAIRVLCRQRLFDDWRTGEFEFDDGIRRPLRHRHDEIRTVGFCRERLLRDEERSPADGGFQARHHQAAIRRPVEHVQIDRIDFRRAAAPRQAAEETGSRAID